MKARWLQKSAVLTGLSFAMLGACGAPRSDVEPASDLPGPEVSDSLAIELDLPDDVSAGDGVPITIRLRNTSSAPITLHLMGRTITFDLIVTDADGAVVWQRLEDESVMAILRLETLEPGAVVELSHTWDQRTKEGAAVPPGAYTVRGSVPTDQPEPLRTPTEPLRISPP